MEKRIFVLPGCNNLKIMKYIFLFALLSVINCSYCQDSVSVLFIGNSYTAANDLPGSFVALSASLGKTVLVDSKVNGGYTFQMHGSDPITHSKIQAKPWDYVVLQGQSQEPSFPTAQVNSQTLPYAESLADSVYANNFCSQALFFMTWGRENGDLQWDSINTFDKMNLRLRNAYLRFSDSVQGSVAPVGVAWKYVRDNHPSIALYSGDGSHPSVAGTYLSACTFYASVFRESPVGASFTMGLDAQVASDLQNAAALAVLDSLNVWHLRPKEGISIAYFSINQNNHVIQCGNESWRSNDYLWNFGDGSFSNEVNPQYVYSSPGIYTVQLISSSSCGADTMEIEIQVVFDDTGIDELPWGIRLVTTNSGVFELQWSEAENKPKGILVRNNLGKVLLESTAKTIQEQSVWPIDLSAYSPGIYFIHMNLKNQTIGFKVIKP
jgi:PKD repeat protein